MDGTFDDLDASAIDALVVPGGTVNADRIRKSNRRQGHRALPGDGGTRRRWRHPATGRGSWSGGLWPGPPPDQLPTARRRRTATPGGTWTDGGRRRRQPHHQPQSPTTCPPSSQGIARGRPSRTLRVLTCARPDGTTTAARRPRRGRRTCGSAGVSRRDRGPPDRRCQLLVLDVENTQGHQRGHQHQARARGGNASVAPAVKTAGRRRPAGWRWPGPWPAGRRRRTR